MHCAIISRKWRCCRWWWWWVRCVWQLLTVVLPRGVRLRRCRGGCCCCLVRSPSDPHDETGQQRAVLLAAAASAPDQLWRRAAGPPPTSLPVATAPPVVKTTLVADDLQAQHARFRSTLVQRLVDDGGRQQQFQRPSASDSRRHLRQRVPAPSRCSSCLL